MWVALECALRADAEDAKGDLKEALQYYERAHDADPASLYPLVTLGAINAALGYLGNSKRWYDQLKQVCLVVLDAGEDDYWTHLCLGEAAVTEENRDEALESYNRALELGAPPGDVVSALEQLQFLMERELFVDTVESVLAEFSAPMPREKDDV